MPVVLWPSPHPSIRCLVQSTEDAGLAQEAAPAGLLVAEEQAHFETLRIPKRRRDWLLGRWTAKNLVASYLAERGAEPRLDQIQILAEPSGAPVASLRWPDGAHPLPLDLSISHSGGWSFCALTNAPSAAVGADVEMIEPRPISLAEQFFAAQEQAALLARPQSERDLLITLAWSAKEAFLKCIKAGLRVDTRSVVVDIPPVLDAAGAWKPLFVTAAAGAMPEARVYRSWWRQDGAAILTLGLLTPPASVDLT